jgi:hypothetical protein
MRVLLWRQHRAQALWTVLSLAALCALMLGVRFNAEHWLTGYHQWLHSLAAAGCPPPDAHSGTFHVRSAATCAALKDRYPGGLQASFTSQYNFAIVVFQDGVPAAMALIGALVGGPMVAREIEERTHLTAWTQSVSRLRWYVTKVLSLAGGLVVVGAAAGLVNGWLQRPLIDGGLISSRWSWFSSSDLAVAGEAVLALALGVAFGALLRRTLPAIGSALIAFIVLLVGAQWAVRTLTPATSNPPPGFMAPAGGWIVHSEADRILTYHPASQYWLLQVTLLGVLLCLSAALFITGWEATRSRAV